MHNLLIESIQKLPIGKQQELHPLPSILDQITQAKLAKEFSTNSLPLQSPDVLPVSNQENIPHSLNPIKTSERGVIRGVLTPNALEKNIFRYNDPTVQPFLNQSQKSNNHNSMLNPLQHSHSTSSISSHQSSSTNYNSNISSNNHHSTVHHHYIAVEKPRNNYFYTSVNGLRNSATSSNAVRANTLPRNNLNGNNQIVLSPDTEQEPIQIGYDQSKAFIRKSPTPLVKSHAINGSRGRNLNGSQLSLLSENSIGRNAINLGIPHHSNGNAHIACGAIIQTAPGPPRDIRTNHSNMPLNLEDLDDLLKYADEQSEQNLKQKNELTAKGSNVSIGVCSSGYQSITNQSQSSSPTEGTSAHTHNNNHNGLKSSSYGQIVPKYSGSNYSSNNNNNNNPPLAFKNPLYQLQTISSDNNNKSSSLTPASSEEQVNGDYYNLDASINGNYCDNTKISALNSLDVNSSGRVNSVSRIPRTNPLHYNKRNENSNKVDEPFVQQGESGFSRHHRRLSLESARTLSDSSTDTEGNFVEILKIIERMRIFCETEF